MGLIGMPEAGRRLGVSGASAKRALANAGVALARINGWSYAVEESDLEAFLARRAGYSGRGRPRRRRPEAPAEEGPRTAASAPEGEVGAEKGPA